MTSPNTAVHHVERLRRRRDWVAQLITEREVHADDNRGGLGFYRAEKAALDWALPILEEHVEAMRAAGLAERVERDAVAAQRLERKALKS